MKTKLLFCLLSALPLVAAADVTITMNQVGEAGVGAKLGQVVVSESKYGLVFTPALTGLTPGSHGFHVHQNADCSSKEKDGKMVPALGAGGHYDPENSNRHGTPWGDGHMGDLPPLYVDASGNATQPVLAPRLKMADLKGRSLMIHVGGDNHSDHPAVLGGGGARMVCGAS
ncbi:superoxide dismutase [Cu-Zn] SodC [Undibacterium sp. Di27W]|uniref:superoxide dismutase [Cu-Zn] SodC n=1 Tax=Undibacterium sp. Di27W TaxID=3413036 RepID=UPI003BEF79EC